MSARLRDRGVRIGDVSDTVLRAVTHIDVDRAGVERAADALADVMKGGA